MLPLGVFYFTFALVGMIVSLAMIIAPIFVLLYHAGIVQIEGTVDWPPAALLPSCRSWRAAAHRHDASRTGNRLPAWPTCEDPARPGPRRGLTRPGWGGRSPRFVRSCSRAAATQVKRPARPPGGEEILCTPARMASCARACRARSMRNWTGPRMCRNASALPTHGDGVRLLYKGRIAGDEPLLIVIGIARLRAGETSHNVPVNITCCARARASSSRPRPRQVRARRGAAGTLAPDGTRYRLTGRGYCTQPARALSGDGAVLMSRFDVVAIVDYR